MFEQSRETLPVAPSTTEDLMRRIQIEKEIREQIVSNSYNPENTTNGMLGEYKEEFNKTERQIGQLGIELSLRQLAT